MKVIDYEKTKGYFEIQYLDDPEIIKGTINIDEFSMNNEAVVTKLIINNCVEDIVTIEDKNNLKFKIISKNIDIYYKEMTEYDFFESFNIYNERVQGIESKYVNISESSHYSSDDVLFQFYYKNAEVNEKGTPSYILKNIFEKSPRTSDEISPEGYFNEFDILCRAFKTNFLAKNDMNALDYNFCCIPKLNINGINNSKLIIEEITKRDVRLDNSEVFNKKSFDKIAGKNIILIDGIISDDTELMKYKKMLIEAGAKSVIMYAFAKASIEL